MDFADGVIIGVCSTILLFVFYNLASLGIDQRIRESEIRILKKMNKY